MVCNATNVGVVATRVSDGVFILALGNQPPFGVYCVCGNNRFASIILHIHHVATIRGPPLNLAGTVLFHHVAVLLDCLFETALLIDIVPWIILGLLPQIDFASQNSTLADRPNGCHGLGLFIVWTSKRRLKIALL